jgi:hypothetical protein
VLPLLAWNLLLTLFNLAYTQLRESGYTWGSPLVWLCKILPVRLWQSFIATCIYIRLVLWIYVQTPCPRKGKTSFEGHTDLAVSYEQRAAMMNLARMSVWDMAAVIMERDDLKVYIAKLEPTIRQHVMREVKSTTKTLGNRAVSWRISHEKLLSDYNHCRRTLDFMVHTILCGLLHLDPSTGTSGKQFFRSAWLVTTDEPLANGLHYKPATMCVSSSIMCDRKNRCTVHMAMILKDLRRGTQMVNRYGHLPTMDLYNDKTWAFDLRYIGFSFASFLPQNNPIDLNTRQAKPSSKNEIEDYAVQGRILKWFNDLPARLKKQRQLSHLFYCM